MNRSPAEPFEPIRAEPVAADGRPTHISSVPFMGREDSPIRLEGDEPEGAADPGAVVRTCANCGAAMDERKCKLICRCGYFASCSDYY